MRKFAASAHIVVGIGLTNYWNFHCHCVAVDLISIFRTGVNRQIKLSCIWANMARTPVR